MPQYSFDLPILPRGGKSVEAIEVGCDINGPRGPVCVRDLVLHALIARVADTDNNTHEFESRFFPEINTLEMDSPEYVLDFLETVNRGPKMARYINWLTGQHKLTRTMVLSVAGGWPSTTSGASQQTLVEFGSNNVNVWLMDFSASTTQYGEWTVPMPAGWNGGTLTAKFYWTSAVGTSGYTRWGFQAVSICDDTTIDTAWGEAQYVEDPFIAQNRMHISSDTLPITIGGEPEPEKFVNFRVFRDAPNDTMNGNARLASVKIEYIAKNL